MDGQDGREKGMLRREILQNLITEVKFDAQISPNISPVSAERM